MRAFSPDHVRLVTDSDPAAIAELVQLIECDVPKYVATLARCAEAHDWLGVARAAHAIRGAVGNVAADRVQTLAARISAAAREPYEPAVTANVPQLEAAVATLIHELSEWVAS